MRLWPFKVADRDANLISLFKKVLYFYSEKAHVKVAQDSQEKLIAPEEISVKIRKEIKAAAKVSYCVKSYKIMKLQDLTSNRIK